MKLVQSKRSTDASFSAECDMTDSCSLQSSHHEESESNIVCESLLESSPSNSSTASKQCAVKVLKPLVIRPSAAVAAAAVHPPTEPTAFVLPDMVLSRILPLPQTKMPSFSSSLTIVNEAVRQASRAERLAQTQ